MQTEQSMKCYLRFSKEQTYQNCYTLQEQLKGASMSLRI